MSLSDLPTELIVHVFKSVDNISSASTLSQASRHLHNVWRYNLASILDAVLRQVIECYDEAGEFLEISATVTSLAGRSSVEDQAKAAIVRAKNFLILARVARDAQPQFTLWIGVDCEPRHELVGRRGCTGISGDQSDPIGPEPFTHISFLRGFYRAMSMTYLAEKAGTKRYQFLASMNLLHFFQMVDILEWIWRTHYTDSLPFVDLLGRRYPPRVAWAELHLRGLEKVEEGLDFLELLESELVGLPGVEQLSNRPYLVKPNLHWLILYQDCPRDITEVARGIALADLLPILPKNSSIHSNDKTSRRDQA
ncbi:MAG: hypothetical protein ALECFALPRED_002228 [Alectoria fallacina]|uniref:F-box domain-containing protein n=1 Tax=Alectoria fallacina TaxID=1903189 RepID=A0A8H3FIW8_9LECA|nr:MAG: hypothetical protein ALECFALPRED_002228 [Alectoria fallacina]